MPPSRALSSRWLGRVFNVERATAASEVPLYLCPAFRSLSVAHATVRRPCRSTTLRPVQIRRLHTETIATASPETPTLTKQPTKTLPLQCHGCGALSQTAVPNEAGFFDVSRKAVRQYLGLEEEGEARAPANVDRIVQEALRSVDVEALEQQGINLKALLPERAPETRAPAADKTPICERCHKLIHHSSGTSIYHPSIDSLRDTVEESPYKINHVYHVLDAADFPMSLLPRLQNLLDVTQRTQNRRAKVKFQHGKRTEMSFIISRSDLLAPGKEQIDSLMPYITETLREALGRVGGRIRLGNVHCVSAKRGWWTKELKEEIWKRGGAGWMVGKANVGKSQLFEAVFPKGRMDWAAPKHEVSVKVFPKSRQSADPFSVLEQPDTATGPESSNAFVDNTFLPGTAPSPEENSLLPPPQPETNYPEMPVVSPLPGTTASPIRVPFGNGRGELIDLPGLNRSDLEFHVRESARHSLVMKWRVVPEQKVLKPGQSLLLGGFIRLTPRNVAPDEELVFLAYAFTPIEPHTTATEKAIIVQTQGHGGPKIKNIALPGTGDKIKHAGAFQVRYDVTKARTGPITRKEAVGLKVAQLPYRVLGIDILVEGCGWVEVVVQVRTRQLFPDLEDSWEPRLDLRPDAVNAEKKKKDERAPEPTWPVIDVYSPEGKFIGYRPPMNAWALNKPKKDTRSRPRRSMKAAKKTEKWVRRAGEGGEGVGRSSFE